MSEQEPNGNNNLDDKPNSLSRRRGIAMGGFGGSLFGGASFLVANAIDSKDAAGVGGFVFTTTVLGVTGRMSSHISLHQAEDYRDQGNNTKMKLKLAQAYVENSVYTLPLGIMGAIGLDNVGLGLITTWLTFSAINQTYTEWQKRIKEYPKLILPEGNSIQQDLTYPDRMNGFKLPPLFYADSIKDVKEFREINKEKIVEWSDSLPRLNEPLLNSTMNPAQLLTSVIIIPNIRHYPVMDPTEEGTTKMRLMDNDDFVIADLVENSEPVWDEPTIFEDEISGMRLFDKSEWERWKNKSWKESIALLVQYRNTKSGFRKPKLVDIVDKYWLLDILNDDDDGDNEEELEKVKAPQLIPLFET
jgi:hypothetical protein